MKPLIVGLDLGTSLCKAAAFELDGTLVESAQKGIKTYRPRAGWAEQDPAEWRKTVIEVLAKLVTKLDKRASCIEVIGLSSHGPSVIPTDANFHPLGCCPIWQDQRAAGLVDDLVQQVGEDWIGLGTPESSFGVQLYWLILNRPELLEKAAHLLDVKGYLLANLTGRAVDEPSSSPGGVNVHQSLFETLGVDLGLLAKSVPSLSVVGNLTPEIRNSTKLPSKVKVVAGLNDGAAATLGAGVVKLGQGIVSLSTNGVMRTTIHRRLPGATLRAKSMFCYSYVNDMYVTGGMTKCGGDSVKWLVENFYQGHGNDNIYARIETEAAQSPIGANGVTFMPYLIGMGTPSPTKVPQGAFVGLGRHHKRADFARAVLEGTVFALKDIGETLDDLKISWDRLCFTGGGSKNPVWRQIVADILGKPLSGVHSDSVLGVALVAATGIGLFETINDAVQAMMSKGFNVEPIENNIEHYEQIYVKYKLIKNVIKEIADI